MSLFSEWEALAQAERSPRERDAFWNEYFDQETENYKAILGAREARLQGTFTALAERFSMEPLYFMGFLDGINSSLQERLELDAIEASSEIELNIDFEKLYFNMLECKAHWLYTLAQWDGILSEERRKEITKEFRTSKMFVNTETVGRNDPCPCGSGKKYKKCCGKDV